MALTSSYTEFGYVYAERILQVTSLWPSVPAFLMTLASEKGSEIYPPSLLHF